MTPQIHRGDTFLGFPATTLKALLISWDRGNREPHTLSELASLNLAYGACVAFLSECHDRGFFEKRLPRGMAPEDYQDPDAHKTLELSSVGLAVKNASARKRVPKERAGKVLASVIDNAARLLDDPRAPKKVTEIWVFGSYLDSNREDVGDLDVVVSSRWRPRFPIQDFRGYVTDNYPGTVPDSAQYYQADQIWLDRMLFGKRRDPMISVHPIEDLIALYCPCRLVFDSKRGGRIPPEEYLHHPNSTGLAPTVYERSAMPALGEISKTFVPTSASVLVEDADRSCVSLYTNLDELPPVLHTHFDGLHLDGRNGLAACEMDGRGPWTCFYVSRHVEWNPAFWRYTMNIKAVYLHKLVSVRHWQGGGLSKILGALFNSDMLCLADRRSKLSVFPVIELDAVFCPRCNPHLPPSTANSSCRCARRSTPYTPRQ